jgi:SAM-dependent methyltransferase
LILAMWQDSLTAAELQTLAEAIIRVARDLRHSVPAPRGMPFFGLDMTLCDPGVLDRFSAQGIFRKYQRAVSLAGGLGGAARWWASRFGCSVLSVEPCGALAAGARRLGLAAGSLGQAAFQTGDVLALPLRECRFTNAWSGDGLGAVSAPEALAGEVFRVLRPGGFFALRIGGRPGREAAAGWTERLAAAGFYGLRSEELPAAEIPQAVLTAEQRLQGYLQRTVAAARGEALRAAAAEMARVRRDHPGVLLYAERPP